MNLPMLDPEWVEQTYLQWLEEPESVSAEWQAFFKGFELGHRPTGPATGGRFHQEAAAQHLIQRYRELGHTQAHIDPLSEAPAPSPRFSLDRFGFSAEDLDTQFTGLVGDHPAQGIVRQTRYPGAFQAQAGYAHRDVQLGTTDIQIQGRGLLQPFKIRWRQPDHGFAESN